jgi:hypothetical protein
MTATGRYPRPCGSRPMMAPGRARSSADDGRKLSRLETAALSAITRARRRGRRRRSTVRDAYQDVNLGNANACWLAEGEVRMAEYFTIEGRKTKADPSPDHPPFWCSKCTVHWEGSSARHRGLYGVYTVYGIKVVLGDRLALLPPSTAPTAPPPRRGPSADRGASWTLASRIRRASAIASAT